MSDTKPTITQEDRLEVERRRALNNEPSAYPVALELAAALREERERNAETAKLLACIEDKRDALLACNAELERAVGELRDALLRSKKMIGPHSLHPDAEGFCIVEHALASTAHLVAPEKEQK